MTQRQRSAQGFPGKNASGLSALKEPYRIGRFSFVQAHGASEHRSGAMESEDRSDDSFEFTCGRVAEGTSCGTQWQGEPSE